MPLEFDGLAGAEDALEQLAELPAIAGLKLELLRLELPIHVRVNNLFVQHSVGDDVVAVTFPATNKDGWISVLDPTPGTSSSGGIRKRFDSQQAALRRSSDHAEQVARSRLDAAEQKAADAAQRALLEELDRLLK